MHIFTVLPQVRNRTGRRASGRQNENTKSIALRLDYGPFSYYTGGDVAGSLRDTDGNPVNIEVMVGQACGKVDVCKTNHHAYKDAMKEDFIKAIEENFVVEKKGADIYTPNALHNFAMYIDGEWYSMTAKAGTYDDNDPIGVLDVTVLSNLVLDKVLGIADLRTSKRIDFVGGIRGLGELQKRVDSGEMKVAFALYPVSMQQLIDIADTGNIMPPKTTWFEPKLRSGVVIHSFEE